MLTMFRANEVKIWLVTFKTLLINSEEPIVVFCRPRLLLTAGQPLTTSGVANRCLRKCGLKLVKNII